MVLLVYRSHRSLQLIETNISQSCARNATTVGTAPHSILCSLAFDNTIITAILIKIVIVIIFTILVINIIIVSIIISRSSNFITASPKP